jgi:hypothetical protein
MKFIDSYPFWLKDKIKSDEKEMSGATIVIIVLLIIIASLIIY